MAFFDALRRLFGGTDRNGGSGEPTLPGSSGSPATTGSRDTSGSPTASGSSTASGAMGETVVAMIPCDEASARLFEYLDGELEGVSEEEVRRHLEVCEACYPRVQFEKHFLEALRRSQDGGRVSESLRDRVLQSLAEDEGHKPD